MIKLNFIKDRYIFLSSIYCILLIMYLCASAINLQSEQFIIVKLLPVYLAESIEIFILKSFYTKAHNKLVLMGILNLFIFQVLLNIVIKLPHLSMLPAVDSFNNYFFYTNYSFVAIVLSFLILKNKNIFNAMLKMLILAVIPYFKFSHLESLFTILTVYSLALYIVILLTKYINTNYSISSLLDINTPRVYISTLFVTIMIAGNIYALQNIHIFNLSTPAGMICFPFTYCISDIITEIYGYRFAKNNILRALLILFIFVTYIKLILISINHLDITANSFTQLFSLSPALLRGTVAGYLSGELINSKLLSILKYVTRGLYFIRRSFTSTIIGITTDTFAFNFATFIGILSIHDIFKFSISQYVLKVLVVIVGIFLSSKMIKLLRLTESYDTFDCYNFSWVEKFSHKKES